VTVIRSARPRIGLLALIWGSAFLWIKLADRGFSAVKVTLARLVLGAAVLCAIVLARRETSWQAAGLIVGFTGAVLIFTPWHTASGLVSAGALECLSASVSYIYMDRFLARRGIGSVVLSTGQLAAASVMLAIALVVSAVPTPQVTVQNVAAIAVLGDHRDRVRVRAELSDHHQRGRDRRIDGDLSAAGGRHRARRPGPQREHYRDDAGWYCSGPAWSGLTRRRAKPPSDDRQSE
jgi:hypothetical protein